MRRCSYPAMLAPALCLGLFAAELFRRHGYESLGNPVVFGIALALVVLSVLLCWIVYSLLLSRFAVIELERALLLDLMSYTPFLLLAAYFVPAVGRLVNIGTLLFFSSLLGTIAAKAVVLLYYRRSAVQGVLSRPYVGLGLIVGLAVLLRVSLIAANRFHGDEALYSHWGLLIASGKDIFLRNTIVDKPPVFLYTLALFFRVFGPTETAARLPNIMASIASIFILHSIVRQLYDARAAILSALFLALSPFDIQFAPTAFTDPLMVALVLASGLLALRGRYLVGGIVMGLAVMTKPTAVFLLPLSLFLGAVPIARNGFGRRFAAASLRLATGFGMVLLAVACWEVIIRVHCVNFMSASAARYGGLGLVPLERVLPRVRGWMEHLQYLTGAPALNVLLVAGMPALVAYGSWRQRPRPGWLSDCAFAGLALCFVAAHTLLSFRIWDRYLLGLVPVLAVLLSRIVLLPYDSLLRGGQFNRTKAIYFSVLGLFLLATLIQPTRLALRYGFPVGGDHGAFQGIEDVSEYFRANVPAGSILFHKWLGWHYSFYMFDLPLEFYYYPSFEFVLDTAQRSPPVGKYVVFPSWTNPDELGAFLRGGGWELRDVYRTFRPDGSLSFTVYRIQAMER